MFLTQFFNASVYKVTLLNKASTNNRCLSRCVFLVNAKIKKLTKKSTCSRRMKKHITCGRNAGQGTSCPPPSQKLQNNQKAETVLTLGYGQHLDHLENHKSVTAKNTEKIKDWVKAIEVFYLIFDIYICPLHQKIGLIKRNKIFEELTSGLINTMH